MEYADGDSYRFINLCQHLYLVTSMTWCNQINNRGFFIQGDRGETGNITDRESTGIMSNVHVPNCPRGQLSTWWIAHVFDSDRWTNGNRYVGDWKDGVADGTGEFTYGSGLRTGEKYNGQFRWIKKAKFPKHVSNHVFKFCLAGTDWSTASEFIPTLVGRLLKEITK